MKKIKWKNMALLIILILCSSVILKDMYMLTIYSSITGKLMGLSFIGIIELIACVLVGVNIIEYFDEKKDL